MRCAAPSSTALRDAIEQSLAAGIDAKGATIDDFRHVDGARGSFQDRFLVHRREGEPCVDCGTTIRKLVVGGRGTYVCERCQPRPRAGAAARARRGRDERSGGEQLGEPAGAVGGQQLLEAAERLTVDHDLREGDHPGASRAARRDRPGPVPD